MVRQTPASFGGIVTWIPRVGVPNPSLILHAKHSPACQMKKITYLAPKLTDEDFRRLVLEAACSVEGRDFFDDEDEEVSPRSSVKLSVAVSWVCKGRNNFQFL